MPYKKRNRGRIKRKPVNSKKAVTQGATTPVLVKSPKGNVMPGVRRIAPFSETVQEIHTKQRTISFGIRLTRNEIEAFEECRYRMDELQEQTLQKLCRTIIFNWINDNPPVKNQYRTYKFLWNDHRKSIIYRNKRHQRRYGHVRMMDYDPITQMRTAGLHLMTGLLLTIREKSIIQDYVATHGIGLTDLVNFAFTEFFVQTYPHLKTPHWHDEGIMDRWHESLEILSKVRHIKIFGDKNLENL